MIEPNETEVYKSIEHIRVSEFTELESRQLKEILSFIPNVNFIYPFKQIKEQTIQYCQGQELPKVVCDFFDWHLCRLCFEYIMDSRENDSFDFNQALLMFHDDQLQNDVSGLLELSRYHMLVKTLDTYKNIYYKSVERPRVQKLLQQTEDEIIELKKAKRKKRLMLIVTMIIAIVAAILFVDVLISMLCIFVFTLCGCTSKRR